MNPSPVEGQFGHGGLGHFLKPTDWLYHNLAPKGTVPFDWDQGYDIEAELAKALKVPMFRIPNEDQGLSGSCGGQMLRYYDEVLKAFVAGKFVRKSAKFPYSFVFQPGGGSYGGDLMTFAKNKGVSSEVLCPSYEGGNPPSELFMEKVSDVTKEALVDGETARSNGYSFIVNFDIDVLAQAIRDNKGIGIGILGQNNGTWRSANPLPPTAPMGSSALWGHWLYFGKAYKVAGMKKIVALNSWGQMVGHLGWQEFGEDYVNSGYIEIGMAMGMSPDALYTFSKDLFMGMTDADVFFLQRLLNKNPLTQVAQTGPGSPGNETYYFGQLTKNAVIAYQKLNSIAPAIGYVGPLTRASLNK